MISPRDDSVDRFFTDQEQIPSFADDHNESRQWVDELSLPHSAFDALETQPSRTAVGPLGMSRDSLNGTTTGVHLLQTNAERVVRPVPQPRDTTENASITIQRWYRKNRPKIRRIRAEENRFVTGWSDVSQSCLSRERPDQSIPLPSPKASYSDDRRPPTPKSRPSSAGSTASRHRRTPVPSPRPPSRQDQVRRRELLLNHFFYL